MKIFQTALFASITTLLGLVSADCDVVPTTEGVDGNGNPIAIGDTITGQPDICQTMGPGDYSFVMLVATAGTPIPGGPINPTYLGYTNAASFMIFDNTCKLLGAFSPNTNCDAPYTLEANYLADVMTISVYMDPGDPWFSFAYGNGLFSTGNNGCDCKKNENDITYVSAACGCAFPQSGVLSKRFYEPLQFTA
ncbi:hypothetical protein BGW36DRAFT_358871 [Talaromyces proteolyticus]|uniref:Uncharacterized protein n=1 Tax=Talaromyces proteolyticus TaxID=1131652 RepID=A0AAD4KUI1_9EURO|nr:uncharacterized protein BGW36DRAFT_358871 [Talaromyces proteolyticus]KAH8697056.1 hypothetical protein BGW36DRAFT_358871 [Talaromyces proteolyticus]